MVNIAVRAARAAGNIIVRNMDRIDRLTIASKRSNDFVTEVDRKAEQEIISILRSKFPGHGILAEESGAYRDITCHPDYSGNDRVACLVKG